MSQLKEQLDERREERWMFEAPIQVRTKGATNGVQAAIENLSANGMCIKTNSAWPVGEELLCEMPVGHEKRILHSRVAWVDDQWQTLRPLSSPQPAPRVQSNVEMGLEFVGINEQDRAWLARTTLEGAPQTERPPVTVSFDNGQSIRAELVSDGDALEFRTSLPFLALHTPLRIEDHHAPGSVGLAKETRAKIYEVSLRVSEEDGVPWVVVRAARERSAASVPQRATQDLGEITWQPMPLTNIAEAGNAEPVWSASELLPVSEVDAAMRTAASIPGAGVPSRRLGMLLAGAMVVAGLIFMLNATPAVTPAAPALPQAAAMSSEPTPSVPAAPAGMPQLPVTAKQPQEAQTPPVAEAAPAAVVAPNEEPKKEEVTPSTHKGPGPTIQRSKNNVTVIIPLGRHGLSKKSLAPYSMTAPIGVAITLPGATPKIPYELYHYDGSNGPTMVWVRKSAKGPQFRVFFAKTIPSYTVDIDSHSLRFIFAR